MQETRRKDKKLKILKNAFSSFNGKPFLKLLRYLLIYYCFYLLLSLCSQYVSIQNKHDIIISDIE